MDSKANFERLLNHTCDVYHYMSTDKLYGYGISSPVDNYPDKPDIKNALCHITAESLNVVQGSPVQEITARRKALFPIGTDIRHNDLIIYDGLRYYAEPPENIRNHHISVHIQRKDTDSYATD